MRPRKPERQTGSPQRQLSDFASGQLETLRGWRAEGHGLLPWGAVREGGFAFWLKEPADDPDSWPVVAASQECDYWDRFDGTVCEFLTEVVAAHYDASGFTEGPIRVVIDESGVHKTAQPIILPGSRCSTRMNRCRRLCRRCRARLTRTSG